MYSIFKSKKNDTKKQEKFNATMKDLKNKGVFDELDKIASGTSKLSNEDHALLKYYSEPDRNSTYPKETMEISNKKLTNPQRSR